MASSRNGLQAMTLMAIKARDIPTILIERIEASHPRPAYFETEDTDEWPAGVLTRLLDQGVLAEADRAEATTCPGCEWRCRKHVEVRKAGTELRASIGCDEEPDYGRIRVSLDRLRRFESELRRLGLFVARMLNFGSPKVSRNLSAYALGAVKGRHGERSVLVAVKDGQLVLGVGEQREPMPSCIEWGSSGLTLDKAVVSRLANRKEGTSAARRQQAPDRAIQAQRKRETLKRHRNIYRDAKRRRGQGNMTWSAVAREIVGSELVGELTFQSIRRIITEQRGLEGKNPRSKSRSRK